MDNFPAYWCHHSTNLRTMGLVSFPLLLFPFFFQILAGIYIVSVSGQCLIGQRSKLLELKGSLHFHPAKSSKLVHWNQSRDCCTWNGAACDASGQVIGLELNMEYISAASENWKSLFTLQHLEILNLAGNDFYPTTIPNEIQNLKNLKYLNLSDAGFVGKIPNGVSRLKNLVSLDLSSFYGDPSLNLENPGLLQNLTEVRELHLDGVNISAQGNHWSNSLSTLSNLRVLSLRNCYLSGPISSSLLELSSLSVISLDGNDLTKVPDFFANFSNLTTLSLGSCNLRGKFPEKIFQVPMLENLDLSYNDLLTGTLPEFPKSGSFREIVLSRTKFSGLLPDSIGNLHALSRIDFSRCGFYGAIPSAMGNLRELVYLDLSSNNFSGSIPPFQMSRKLEFIHLGNNHLTGSLPPSLFALPSLQQLLLSNNFFEGRVHEFPNASASLLNTLDLSSNCLEGSIPVSLFNLERLSFLSLSFNSFSGTVQLEMFKRLHNLRRLELSYNNLSVDESSTSLSLFAFPDLGVLKLASCDLRKFPDLTNQSSMWDLDLSANHITGEIPNWIWKDGLEHLNLSFNLLQDLQKPYSMPNSLLLLDLHANLLQGSIPPPPLSVLHVDYSTNYFSGPIPVNIGEDLHFFSLSNNSITGAIPESICKASYLQVLDLNNNFLSGGIPSCLFDRMGALGVLNLGRNNLHGIIPDTFPINCGLQTLDLRRNRLEGKIPGSLVNCSFLQVLNVGNNNILDTFPCILMNISNLHIIGLQSNRFYGDLQCPWENYSWPNLQILDISNNNFSGALPPGLFLNWRGLMIAENSQPSANSHLQYEIWKLSEIYYDDSMTLTIKGLSLELVKILNIFTYIDFSCNKFHGKIPYAVGQLKVLYILNFSHNALTGSIPESIGNLTQLGALDLSMNQLSGIIPLKLEGLTFLPFLNLSFNQLFGKIPTGGQFQTFSNASFLGNKGLCGFQLNISCTNLKTKELLPVGPFKRHSRDRKEINWEFITAALGFAVGLGIVFWLYLFSTTYNSIVDQVLVKILSQEVLGRGFGVAERVDRNPIRRL